ncbi:MAG: PEP-CTERM sorting domain-containing protein [Verrucomicrobiota bacterium]
MKKRNLTLLTLLALAGAGIGVSPARAANVPVNTTTSTTGDLILGFQGSQTGTGTPVVLEIDLGLNTLFNKLDGSTFTLSSVLLADLNSTFGSGWYTSGLVKWGVVGTTSNTGIGVNAKNTIYGTNAAASAHGSTAFANGTGSAQAGAQSQISALYQGLKNTAALAGNANAALVTQATTNSYTLTETSAANQTFAYFTPGQNAVDGVVGSSVLDLYQLSSTNNTNPGTTYLGTFTIDANATARFAAVPEPSTYVMLLGSLGAFFVFRRNRRANSPAGI